MNIDSHITHGATSRYRHFSDAELTAALTSARQRAWMANSDVEDLMDEARSRRDHHRQLLTARYA